MLNIELSCFHFQSSVIRYGVRKEMLNAESLSSVCLLVSVVSSAAESDPVFARLMFVSNETFTNVQVWRLSPDASLWSCRRPLLQVNACQMKAWPLWFLRAKGNYRMGILAQIIPSWHFRPVVSLAFWTRTGGEMSPSLFTRRILQLNVTLRPHMARAFALCQWNWSVRLIRVTFSIMLMLTLRVTFSTQFRTASSLPRSLDPPGCSSHSFWCDQCNLKYRDLSTGYLVFSKSHAASSLGKKDDLYITVCFYCVSHQWIPFVVGL